MLASPPEPELELQAAAAAGCDPTRLSGAVLAKLLPLQLKILQSAVEDMTIGAAEGAAIKKDVLDSFVQIGKVAAPPVSAADPAALELEAAARSTWRYWLAQGPQYFKLLAQQQAGLKQRTFRVSWAPARGR